MNIAVVGTDSRALAIGRLFASNGYGVDFPAGAGVSARGPWNRADEVVVLAGRRDQLDALIGQAGRLTAETIVIDAMDGRADRTAEEALGLKLGSDRIVRALMVLPQAGANVLCCADDTAAMAVVSGLLRSCGCVPTDRGSLAHVDELEPPSGSLDDEFDQLKMRNTVAGP